MKKIYKIMVVDDDEVILNMMKQLLEASGFLCEVAYDGKKAIKMVSSSLPDLIILDVSMPEMDGYEVCEILRRNDATKEIPIIFLSAQTELKDRIRGFEMGADDYVPKPFSYDELQARIKVALKKVDRLERERKKTEQLEQEAQLDEATGVFTRKYFDQSLKEVLHTSKYSHSPLSLAMIDIDGLTGINNKYGFVQGTRTITHIAHVINEFFKDKGKVARYEGGQFAVIITESELRATEPLAEELRIKIQDSAIESYPSGYQHVTVSIGIVEWNYRERPEQLVKRAEEAMHSAKKTGRNKISCG